MFNLDLINKLLDLSGKTAIVTGGALGIGFGITLRLAEARASVVITDVKQEEAEKAAADLTTKGMKAKAIKVDVSSEDDVKRMVYEAVNAFGSVDILVNNAGVYPNIPVSKLTLADFE